MSCLFIEFEFYDSFLLLFPIGICLIGGDSSLSGRGSAGDYIAVAQSKKPVIQIYQWNKPQVLTKLYNTYIISNIVVTESSYFQS